MTKRAFQQGLKILAQSDPDLGAVIQAIGPPPMWTRPPGFDTLLHIILEQQVSLASARAAHHRLLAAANPLTPAAFAALDEAALRSAGLSRQKAAYGRELARVLLSGELDLEPLWRLDDDQARASLLRIKGIGPWTAEIYLLMALRRPDTWPSGDRALAVATARLKHLPAVPGTAELETLAAAWRPWRAVAARVLWHDYLSRPKGAQLAAAAPPLEGGSRSPGPAASKIGPRIVPPGNNLRRARG